MAALDLKLRKEMQVEVKNLQERLQDHLRVRDPRPGRGARHERPHRGDERGAHRAARRPGGALRAARGPASWPTSWRSRTSWRPRWSRWPAGQAELETRGGNRLRAADDGGYVAGARVLVGVRPERLTLRRADAAADAPTPSPGRLDDEIYLGDRTDWRVRLGDEVVSVAEGAARARQRQRGDAVTVTVPPEAILRLEEPPWGPVLTRHLRRSRPDPRREHARQVLAARCPARSPWSSSSSCPSS